MADPASASMESASPAPTVATPPDTPAADPAMGDAPAAPQPEAQQRSAPPPAYRLKHISIRGRSVPVVMQNENGPCPLLAIANVLLLRNQIQLPGAASEVLQVGFPDTYSPYPWCGSSSEVMRESPITGEQAMVSGSVSCEGCSPAQTVSQPSGPEHW